MSVLYLLPIALMVVATWKLVSCLLFCVCFAKNHHKQWTRLATNLLFLAISGLMQGCCGFAFAVISLAGLSSGVTSSSCKVAITCLTSSATYESLQSLFVAFQRFYLISRNKIATGTKTVIAINIVAFIASVATVNVFSANARVKTMNDTYYCTTATFNERDDVLLSTAFLTSIPYILSFIFIGLTRLIYKTTLTTMGARKPGLLSLSNNKVHPKTAVKYVRHGEVYAIITNAQTSSRNEELQSEQPTVMKIASEVKHTLSEDIRVMSPATLSIQWSNLPPRNPVAESKGTHGDFQRYLAATKAPDVQKRNQGQSIHGANHARVLHTMLCIVVANSIIPLANLVCVVIYVYSFPTPMLSLVVEIGFFVLFANSVLNMVIVVLRYRVLREALQSMFSF